MCADHNKIDFQTECCNRFYAITLGRTRRIKQIGQRESGSPRGEVTILCDVCDDLNGGAESVPSVRASRQRLRGNKQDVKPIGCGLSKR